MKKSIYITIAVLIIGISGFGIYHYINRPVKSISDATADITIAPENLLTDFVKDEKAANARYLDKIIVIEGTISSIKSDEKDNVNILLETGDPMSSVSCVLEKNENDKSTSLKRNDHIKIKGVCTGMLMDVVMVNCVII